MMSFFNYYLKGIKNRVVYTSAVNGRLVAHDEVGTVIDGNEIIIQFVAPVTKASAESGITLYDETAKSQVSGTIVFETNNKLIFNPSAPLVKGHKYTLKVADSVTDEKSGAAIESGGSFDFTY